MLIETEGEDVLLPSQPNQPKESNYRAVKSAVQLRLASRGSGIGSSPAEASRVDTKRTSTSESTIGAARRSRTQRPPWNSPLGRKSPAGRVPAPTTRRDSKEQRVLEDLEQLAATGVLDKVESAALDALVGHSSPGQLEWSFDGVSFDGGASSSQCSDEASRTLGFNDPRMQDAERCAVEYSRLRPELGWAHRGWG